MCKWADLDKKAESPYLDLCPDQFDLPVAHAEGRFVAPEGKAAQYLADGLAALTYTEDINGSEEQIAGMQDSTGRAFGLMPHPERFLYAAHHYDANWDADPEWGWGYYFFKSIFERIMADKASSASCAV